MLVNKNIKCLAKCLHMFYANIYISKLRLSHEFNDFNSRKLILNQKKKKQTNRIKATSFVLFPENSDYHQELNRFFFKDYKAIMMIVCATNNFCIFFFQR